MSSVAADLHTHTDYSDGTESPERVVELAAAAGVQAISLTDHDNVEALAVAAPTAKRVGVELIPGIEMSSSLRGAEVHLLGFLLDVAHPGLTAHLTEQQARRVRRVHTTVERLAAVGVRIPAEEVLALAGHGTVGRPHVARILLKHGFVKDTPEAFERYLTPGRPGFMPGSTMEPARIIAIIRAAGGVPVLAHPVYLKDDTIIDACVAAGLAGLEVFHSGHTPDHVRHYEAIADRLGLLKTGGSDYHGTSKEGVGIGVVKVPYTLVEAMRQWQARHPATAAS